VKLKETFNALDGHQALEASDFSPEASPQQARSSPPHQPILDRVNFTTAQPTVNAAIATTKMRGLGPIGPAVIIDIRSSDIASNCTNRPRK
jgi:hypothetical protein